ncbi:MULTISPECIES: hypothetical protein [Bradyrhizobium]|jgi:hypothetical protein|uniref:hypothetical protein n=1 Tax=Bradyrhizobium TaxID=374 RepID=UPI00041A3E82|nr:MULTISPECIES: hypothetical protein [Bradyrhizobium]MBR0880972.1 hypothetical protein [Bradyrhizobium liaoningense]MBR1002682.1 hypothetical protein [Bradyrhizobium liaoningense]MBR1034577.1 hypothetical protein [Bradyrhizobium liaoningense]MBR1069780.1 hypothetical protein [Bradyrhizobium liaoningense]MCP1744016.1 hypothetical protein [Bradyrhizobium japonicum]
MALLKKKEAAEPYRIPSLAEADPAYAALLLKQSDLYAPQSKLTSERRDLQKRIDESGATGPIVPARVVAELLGDATDSTPMLRKRATDNR